MKIRPVGHMLLVEIDEIKDKTESGLYLPQESRDREQNANISATVVEIGSSCWPDEEPWCKVGDRVLIAKYGGAVLKSMLDLDKDLRIINDEDVIARLEEEN